MLAAASRERPRSIAYWLFAVAFLVFAMVVIGGITRLTESGLSITEWKPLSGAIPPLNAADWQAEFARYQATPEYREINGPAGMDLAAFQKIYFWEWLHRLLGRLIGLAFALPLVWFAIRRAIPRGYGWRLVALLALGGFQGALGWYMVQSGLVNRTDVSHFRLAAHLLTAFLLLGGLIWTALDLRQHPRPPAAPHPPVADRPRHPVDPIAPRRLGRGPQCRPGRQHLAADERPPRPRRHRLVERRRLRTDPRPLPDPLPPPLVGIRHARRAGPVRAQRPPARPPRRARHRHSARHANPARHRHGDERSGPLRSPPLHQAVGALLVAATAWGAHVVGSARQQ